MFRTPRAGEYVRELKETVLNDAVSPRSRKTALKLLQDGAFVHGDIDAVAVLRAFAVGQVPCPTDVREVAVRTLVFIAEQAVRNKHAEDEFRTHRRA